MAKFMLSLRDESFKLLISEAQDRGISIQELIRAVVIPDWVKQNVEVSMTKHPATASSNNRNNHGRAATIGSLSQPTITRVKG